MFVASFLKQVEFSLIAERELMATVDQVNTRRIHLIGIAKADPVEVATYEEGGGYVRTVARSDKERLLLEVVGQLTLNILTPAVEVGHHHEGGL